jgi:hypothetical protein
MTSGRWIIERSELEAGSIKAFPIPSPQKKDLNEALNLYEETINLSSSSFEKKLDEFVFDIYQLKEYERFLISDALKYTLGYNAVKTRQQVQETCTEQHLNKYARILTDVLEKTFNNNKTFSFELFYGDAPLVVAKIILNNNEPNIQITKSKNEELLNQLSTLDKLLVEKHSQGLYIRRNVIIYDKKSIYIVKPNQKRYWTYSSACRDADDIFAQIMRVWRKYK